MKASFRGLFRTNLLENKKKFWTKIFGLALDYMCQRRRHIALETKTKVSAYFKRSFLCKTGDVINKITKMYENEKAEGTCCRIQERDKKNAEYYVGDYL